MTRASGSEWATSVGCWVQVRQSLPETLTHNSPVQELACLPTRVDCQLIAPVNLPPLCPCPGRGPSHIDAGLGHGTCFGPRSISTCDAGRGLQMFAH